MLKSGSGSIDLYVSNIASDIAANVGTKDGSSAKPFSDLLDAIRKAYEMSAPYVFSTVSITLTSGTHYLLKTNSEYYRETQYLDKWSYNVQLTIKGADSANPVTNFTSFYFHIVHHNKQESL